MTNQLCLKTDSSNHRLWWHVSLKTERCFTIFKCLLFFALSSIYILRRIKRKGYQERRCYFTENLFLINIVINVLILQLYPIPRLFLQKYDRTCFILQFCYIIFNHTNLERKISNKRYKLFFSGWINIIKLSLGYKWLLYICNRRSQSLSFFFLISINLLRITLLLPLYEYYNDIFTFIIMTY